jgi:hypothetical protein
MRYLAFFIVMGASISLVRGFDWPTWLQVVAIVLANLLAGAVILGNREEDQRAGEGQHQEDRPA